MTEDIAWGDCICAIRGCVAEAECLLDGLPLCIKCADELLDRMAAISLYPEMRSLLPDISDR